MNPSRLPPTIALGGIAAFAAGCRMAGRGGAVSATGAVLGLVGATVVLLVPGVAIVAALTRRRTAELGPVVATAGLVVGSGLVGFAAFFAWYLDPDAGKAWSIGVLAASTLALATWGSAATRLIRPMITPVALLVVLIVTATGFAFDRGGIDAGAATVTARYWNGDDNLLPEILADKLYEGEDLEPRLYSGWRSSDRPPLQAGWFLIAAPLAGDRTIGYQLAGTALQGLWVLGVWALLSALGVDRRIAILTIVVTAFTGFTFVSTVFVWPKLLAAAFPLLALAVLIERPPPDRVGAAVAAGATGLGLLAHAGAMYATFGLVPLLWTHRRAVLTSRWIGSGIAAGAAVMAPWFAYQRLADPPGDALLKWHLAGVIDVEERFTFAGALRHTYGNLSPVEVLVNKADNIRLQAIGPDWWRGWFFTPGWDSGAVEQVRVAQLTTLLPALGLLVVGALWLHRTQRPPLFGYVSASMLGWIVVQYGDVGPAGAFMHHGPYATFLVVFALLTMALLERFTSPAVVRVGVGVHLAVFAGLWLVGVSADSASAPPHDGRPIAGWSLAVSLAGLATLASIAWRSADPHAGSSPGQGASRSLR